MDVIHWLGWGVAVAFAAGYVRVNGLLTEALGFIERMLHAHHEEPSGFVPGLEDERDYWRDMAVGLAAELDELRSAHGSTDGPASSDPATPRNG